MQQQYMHINIPTTTTNTSPKKVKNNIINENIF